MRRTLALGSVCLLALTACGESDSDATDATDLVDTSQEAEEGGEGDASADEPAATFEDVGPPPTSPDKPAVEIPDEAPDELDRNVLIEGVGEPAEVGDTLIVDYIGVRTVDGVEFDNSYDREPFPITLGAGGVIPGWEQGLLGVRQGERIQLDIPSELAYGEQARSEVIRENEDLTFVIDVRSIVRQPEPGDAPTEPGVPLSEGALETTFEDLVVGEGEEIEEGQTALVRYVNFRGDNGVIIEQNWTADPIQIPFDEELLLPGFYLGLEGMRIGGQRAITVIPEDGFGAGGNPQGGLPADTDMILVIELLGAY